MQHSLDRRKRFPKIRRNRIGTFLSLSSNLLCRKGLEEEVQCRQLIHKLALQPTQTDEFSVLVRKIGQEVSQHVYPSLSEPVQHLHFWFLQIGLQDLAATTEEALQVELLE